MATTAAPYGFWATNPTKKLAYWVYLLGQPLSRNRVFQNFSGEPPLKDCSSFKFAIPSEVSYKFVLTINNIFRTNLKLCISYKLSCMSLYIYILVLTSIH